MGKARVVVELSGGLGNQLFQFAFGHMLQSHLGADLTLDDFRITSHRTGHGSSLRNRRIGGLVDWETLESGKNSSIKRRAGFALSRSMSRFRRYATPVMGYYSPKEIGFSGLPRTKSKYSRVRGYFQSWRYVQDDFPVRRDPSLLLQRGSPSDWFLETHELIRERQPIGVHLRRGDYASASNRKMGLLSAGYFESAINALQVSGLEEVFVFSDDPIEAKAVLGASQAPVRFVTPSDGNDAGESLLLLSQCSAQVLSNSSFSWWSATLGHPGRRIIYPAPWFQYSPSPADLTPGSWEAFPAKWG